MTNRGRDRKASCSATNTVFGVNKDRAQPDPLLAIDWVPLQRYCHVPPVVFVVKLDLIAPDFVHLTWPGPWFTPKKAEMKVPTLLTFQEVDDVEHWLRSPKRPEFLGPFGSLSGPSSTPRKKTEWG